MPMSAPIAIQLLIKNWISQTNNEHMFELLEILLTSVERRNRPERSDRVD
jgi:hypothetical protein